MGLLICLSERRVMFMNRLVKTLFQISDMYMEEDNVLEVINDYSLFIGEICMNRITGIAYKNLEKCHKLRLPKEIENILFASYKDNINRAERFIEKLKYLASIFENANFPYVFLKGAFLTTQLYPKGYRTSNDIDVLIKETDISLCQSILSMNGFVQGYYNRNEKRIIPATRKEILFARMNFGETVPFVKMFGHSELYVDLNFSVDFKPISPDNNLIDFFLDNRKKVSFQEMEFYSLDECDFLIHLCCHLYKEATTIEWVKEHRDLQLYKFSDINVFLHRFNGDIFWEELKNRIIRYGVQKECYYTFNRVLLIYPQLKAISGFVKIVEMIRNDNDVYLNIIVEPKTGKEFVYELPFEEWFITHNKLEYLKIKED